MGYLRVEHVNWSVDTQPKALPFYGKVYFLHVHNVSSNTLYISFDGGQTYKQIGAGSYIELRGFMEKPIWLEKDTVKVKGSASGTDFEMLILFEREE